MTAGGLMIVLIAGGRAGSGLTHPGCLLPAVFQETS
jgi:hypothetical protein